MPRLREDPCISQLNEVWSARRLSCKSIFVDFLTCFAPHYHTKFLLFKKNPDFLLHQMANITLCDSYFDMGSNPKFNILRLNFLNFCGMIQKRRETIEAVTLRMLLTMTFYNVQPSLFTVVAATFFCLSKSDRSDLSRQQ